MSDESVNFVNGSLQAFRVAIGGALGSHHDQPSHLTDENPETQRN